MTNLDLLRWMLVIPLAFAGACRADTTASPAPASAPAPSHESLATAAVQYEGAACSITGENGSGWPAGDECGPFPCTWGQCVVQTCSDEGRCYPGFCVSGYCVRGQPRGERRCDPISPREERVDAGDGEWDERRGCQCNPQNEGRARDFTMCGQFPCGADGCYVETCSDDDDCTYGLCSSHASGPHGYCVTDDPI